MVTNLTRMMTCLDELLPRKLPNLFSHELTELCDKLKPLYLYNDNAHDHQNKQVVTYYDDVSLKNLLSPLTKSRCKIR